MGVHPAAAVPTTAAADVADGNVARGKVGSSGDVLGVRPYRHGDSLGRLLREAIGTDRPPTFGGCYLVVGSVRDSNEAKFARDFFKKVEGSQAAVAWTDDAYAADATYRRIALAGHVALAVLAVAVIALAVFVFITKPFK